MSSSTPEISPSLPGAPILPSSTVSDTPWWGRIELLWLAMAPLCALIFALALPLAPNDLWYHVRAGEFIARGSIPTQNLMSNGVPLSTPYFYQSWLAELALFQTLKWSGLSGLMLLRSFCVSGAVLCVVLAAWRRLARLPQAPSPLVAARWSALAGVLGFALASNNVDLRPQTFSTLFFGVWVLAMGEFRASKAGGKTRWGAFLLMLTLAWANTHGAFVISLLGLAALTTGDAGARREHRSSAALLALSAIVVVFNPRGWELYLYIARLSSDEVSQRFVQEWKSPGFNDWHSVLFWLLGVALLLSVWLPLLRRRALQNFDWGENLASTLFFVAAARDQRAIIWFALWMVPTLSQLAAGNFGGLKIRPTLVPPPVPRAARALNAILLVFLLLCPLLLFPGVKENWPWPVEFRRRFAPTPTALFPGEAPLLLEKTTPVAAAQWLRLHPPRGLVFTDMVCGSYLTYATHPQIRPWCDPRIELFPVAFWEDYLRLSAGPPDAARELETRGFSDALLDSQTQPALVRRLKQNSRWHIVAQNGSTVLFHNGALNGA